MVGVFSPARIARQRLGNRPAAFPWRPLPGNTSLLPSLQQRRNEGNLQQQGRPAAHWGLVRAGDERGKDEERYRAEALNLAGPDTSNDAAVVP